jgi:hypothetical protein
VQGKEPTPPLLIAFGVIGHQIGPLLAANATAADGADLNRVIEVQHDIRVVLRPPDQFVHFPKRVPQFVGNRYLAAVLRLWT